MTPGKRSKKDYLDSTDREILRLLYGSHRPITGRQIALRVNKSAPAIKPRLKLLENKGFLKQVISGKNRVYTRHNKRIIAPSKTLWGLNIEDKKKKKKEKID